MLDKLRIVDISNNLGDSKSLITHPATTTHRAMGPEGRAAIGLGDGVVRISVGLEGTEDLIARSRPGAGLGVSEGSANARSKKTEAKQARRKKRQATQKRGGFPRLCSTALRRHRVAAVREGLRRANHQARLGFRRRALRDESALWYFIPSTAEVPTTGRSCRSRGSR